MYYLNARYYDSETKRFVNADDVSYLGANGDLQGFNLYAYCYNNPIMYADHNGNLGIIATVLISTLVGAAISGGINLATQLIQNDFDFSEVNYWEVGAKALTGGAAGLALGLGGVAGGIVKGSFQLLTIAGKTLSISQSLGLLLGTTITTNFVAGVTGYAMHTAGDEVEEFSIVKGISEGVGQTGKGVLSFFTAGMYVGTGFWNVGIGAKNTFTSIAGRAAGRFVSNYIPNYIFDDLF